MVHTWPTTAVVVHECAHHSTTVHEWPTTAVGQQTWTKAAATVGPTALFQVCALFSIQTIVSGLLLVQWDCETDRVG